MSSTSAMPTKHLRCLVVVVHPYTPGCPIKSTKMACAHHLNRDCTEVKKHPLLTTTMFRQTIRQIARQSPSVVRRSYATEAASDALKLSLALPHETLYTDSEVQQVNLPSVNGDLGILANHIPIVEQLRPGILEIVSKGGETEQYFVSGGLATVQPGNKLTISAIEAFKPDQFDAQSVKELISDAQKRAASSDEVVVAEANIELEVLEALQHVAK